MVPLGDAIIPQKPKKRRARPVVRVQYGALLLSIYVDGGA